VRVLAVAKHVAAIYRTPGAAGIAQATQLGGKEMSYNNYVDADAAVRAAYDHPTPTVAVIKHANPCGIATADSIAAAHVAAHACDPVSAYGGVIALNRRVHRRHLHGGRDRAGIRAEGARDPAGEEEPSAA
jgi:phosphoribosylaminoimidazolecarboxamide formyltransferase/IMP cyclohydrolase